MTPLNNAFEGLSLPGQPQPTPQPQPQAAKAASVPTSTPSPVSFSFSGFPQTPITGIMVTMPATPQVPVPPVLPPPAPPVVPPPVAASSPAPSGWWKRRNWVAAAFAACVAMITFLGWAAYKGSADFQQTSERKYAGGFLRRNFLPWWESNEKVKTVIHRPLFGEPWAEITVGNKKFIQHHSGKPAVEVVDE